MPSDGLEPQEMMLGARDLRLHVLAWPAVAQAGDAPGRQSKAPFLLLHGIASSAATWAPAARLLAGAGHPTFALDFRGHGGSETSAGGFDLDTFARDVADTVSLLDLSGPVLVGHSLGAMAILQGVGSGILDPSAVALVEGGLVDAGTQYESLEQCLASLALPPVNGMPAARVEGFLRSSHPNWTPERLAGAMAAFESLPDGSLRWRVDSGRVESLGRSMWEQHSAELWPEVPVPALVVAADTGDERWTGLKRSAAATALRKLPQPRVAWLAADHDVHADRPAEVADRLLGLAV